MYLVNQIARFSNQPISRTNQWNRLISFASWCKFTKTKGWSKKIWVSMGKIGCDQTGHGTLKLTVFQEWIDGMNWIFACWCKFRKAKSYFPEFWMGVIINLVHKTLKSAVLEWVCELSWSLTCWLWC